MIVSLIVILIVSVALNGPLMAAHPPEGDFIPHYEPAEKHSKKELMQAIREAKSLEAVADALYEARQKSTTELVDGVTVAKLIELNKYVGYEACSRQSLQDRAGVFNKIEALNERETGSMSTLVNYADHVLLETATVCGRFKERATKDVEHQKWLDGLGDTAMESYGSLSGPALAGNIFGAAESPATVEMVSSCKRWLRKRLCNTFNMSRKNQRI